MNDSDQSAQPDWLSPPLPDPVVLDLERKVDVLRAQLEACRRGEDIGAAGEATWSRLEYRAQRCAARDAEAAALLAKAAAYDAILASTAWRITAPLRALFALLKRP